MAAGANNSSRLDTEGYLHFFLVKSGPSHLEVLRNCEKVIKEYVGAKTPIKWITPEECLLMDSNSLSKTDVFIFPEFGGEAFDHLRTPKKALLLGPPCLTRCLRDKISVPEVPPPWIHNLAMNGLVLSLTGFNLAQKTKYTDMVTFMGGLCLSHLPELATHLVCNIVTSSKYEAAVNSGIRVMQAKWIEEVWQRNATEYVSARDPQFDQFQLPTFYNLNVTSSMLPVEEKQMVERLVNQHGGKYYPNFKPMNIDLLILNDSGKGSDKFRAAKKHKKTCLTPRWITDSVAAGYALPFDKYEFSAEVRVSTPKKDALPNPEFSVSHIQGSGNSTVNESFVSVRSKNLSMMSDIAEVNAQAEEGRLGHDYYKECIKNITITNAKRAGCFLDGCNIFFSGFSPTEMNKLNKIVSLSGATRFDEVNENVTHVIIGKRNDKELKAFQALNKGIHFVKFDWLKESMNTKQPANEEEFCYEVAAVANKTITLEQPSPASKRNIAAMNSSFKKPFPRSDQLAELTKSGKPAPTAPEEDLMPESSLMNRYLQSSAANMAPVERSSTAPSIAVPVNNNNPRVSQRSAKEVSQRPEKDPTALLSTTYDSELATEEYENLNFFTGKLFGIQDTVDRLDYRQMVTDIKNFGGKVVDQWYRGEVDFIVTAPQKILNFKPQYKAKQMVSNLWLEDVINARSEVPVEYFHSVIAIKDDTILKDIPCTISTYGGTERIYLTIICQAIGALVEEKYERKKNPILICEKAEGSKYKGALNWEYPVVTKEWLLDSYAKSYLHKLEDYLVGESKLTKKHKVFMDLNERGIHKGAEPPSLNDSDIIRIRSETSLLSQVPPSPGMSSKRTSDDMQGCDDEGETVERNQEKRFKPFEDLVLLPNRSPATTTVNSRVRALRTESKSTASPTTPISQHLREVTTEFGYDTPRRKQLYDVLKETNHLTPHSPHTPAVMRMPDMPLHPDPEASPGRNWDIYHKFSGFMEKEQKKAPPKKKMTPGTPLSEIKRRFWQQTLGEDNYNSTMMNINSQQLDISNPEVTTTPRVDQSRVSASTSRKSKEAVPDAPTVDNGASVLKGLADFINKRKSEPKKTDDVPLETCPLDLECPVTETENRNPDIMVGWAHHEENVLLDRSGRASVSSRESMNRSKIAEPYFLASGIECPSSMVDVIRELKGDIQTKKMDYDARCTHVICSKMARVEKVLCALAAGKWIITVKYIEDSAKAGRFLDEEKYEWGNPKADQDMPAMTTLEKSLAEAAHSWRLKINDPHSERYKDGAFQGFRVLIWSKVEGLKRIITAGGGVCLDVNKTYKKDAEVAKTATHCFVDKKVPLPQENVQFCRDNSIPMYDIQFMNEYLLNENSPRLKTLEYKPL